MNSNKVIVLVGPTAVGKTTTSIELAKHLNGEIINGDALQIYKGLDIGTAKITEQEMQGVPHHLLSFLGPHENFSVADYQKLVRDKIVEITKRGKVPIIVGGTGMYIQAVLYDFQFSEPTQDASLREELENYSAEDLWNQLQSHDPQAANEIHPNNKQRVIRSLERILISGKTKADTEAAKGMNALYPFLIIGLDRNRNELYERINARVHVMFEQGFIEEVQHLLTFVDSNAQSMNAIGYKEVTSYLDGKYTEQEMREAIQQNSRRYAKRQLTYFKNKLPVVWFDAQRENEKIVLQCERFLKDSDQRIEN